jgi:membrane protein required for colicin V production
MPFFDIIIVLILLVSGLISVARGFAKEFVSLATWVVAMWVAITFSADFADILPQSLESIHFSVFGHDFAFNNLRLGIAFVLMVVLVLIAGFLVNKFFSSIMRTEALRSLDKMLGFIFGLARGAIIIVIGVIIAGLSDLPSHELWQESQLITYFEAPALWVINLLPDRYIGSFVYG